jgi:succinoglycan biosynthesis transport protein ExoP
MLHVVANRVESLNSHTSEHSNSESSSLIEAYEFAKRSRKYMLLGAAIGAVIGVIYLFIATPLFEGSVTLIIDDLRKEPTVTTQGILGRDAITDNAMVESQIEVIQSANVAQQVINKLTLTSEPEFTTNTSFISKAIETVVHFFTSPFTNGVGPDQKESLKTRVLEKFQSRLSVTRVGASYVLEIKFLSEIPQRSATIAKAVAEAYSRDVIDARDQAAETGSQWLESRIVSLREKSLAAEQAVADFKAKNNITQTNAGAYDEQKVGNFNIQLDALRSKTAEAEAKLNQITAILRSSQNDFSALAGNISDAITNGVIVKLRDQYLEDVKRAAELSSKYGTSHRTVVDLRAEMQVLAGSIREELTRIAQAYKSDYDIAVQHEKSIAASLGNAVKESSVTNFQRVKLHELESVAETYHAIYANFLERYLATSQRQSYPITEARIIAEPPPPTGKSKPNTLLTLGLSIFAGFASGLGVALLKEQLHKGFRTTDEIEKRLGLASLGVLPNLSPNDMVDISRSCEEPVRQGGQIRSLGCGYPISRFSVLRPLSRFSETIRGAKLAVERRRVPEVGQIIGIISSMSGEGKSTFSSNIAFSLAYSGEPTLLLDLDLRKTGLTRALVPPDERTAEGGMPSVLGNAGRGIASVLHLDISEAVLIDRETKLHFLPSVIQKGSLQTSDVLSSAALRQIFLLARKNYAYVVVDLPPLAQTIDAKVISEVTDTFLLVVEWGKTPRNVVTSIFKSNHDIAAKTCGFVMNKVDISVYCEYSSLPKGYYDY